jgi:diguanylate cyclase (GGDEF)-like protein
MVLHLEVETALLPETGCRDATLIAERLRADIEALRLQHEGHEIRFTASFGVAQCKAQHQSLDVLISAADNCLYQAKEAGRNRVAHSEADTAWQVISP